MKRNAYPAENSPIDLKLYIYIRIGANLLLLYGAKSFNYACVIKNIKYIVINVISLMNSCGYLIVDIMPKTGEIYLN